MSYNPPQILPPTWGEGIKQKTQIRGVFGGLKRAAIHHAQSLCSRFALANVIRISLAALKGPCSGPLRLSLVSHSTKTEIYLSKGNSRRLVPPATPNQQQTAGEYQQAEQTEYYQQTEQVEDYQQAESYD